MLLAALVISAACSAAPVPSPTATPRPTFTRLPPASPTPESIQASIPTATPPAPGAPAHTPAPSTPTRTLPVPTLTATLAPLPAPATPTGSGGPSQPLAPNSLGYVGCSNTVQAIDAYHKVPGSRGLFWENVNYDLGGASMDQWVKPNAPYWARLDNQIATNGQPLAVWIELCVKPNTGTTYDTVKQVLARLRTHTPAALFYISPLNLYDPPTLCPPMGNFWQNTITWSDQAVAAGLARRGPDLGPITPALVGEDGCHLGGEGTALVAKQLASFFDSLGK